MTLNKKQLLVGWIMIALVALSVVRTIFAMRTEIYLSIQIFTYSYFLIFIFGILLVYVLRDKKKQGA
jgi:high-affinity Fe2+/Pb2+ permease